MQFLKFAYHGTQCWLTQRSHRSTYNHLCNFIQPIKTRSVNLSQYHSFAQQRIARVNNDLKLTVCRPCVCCSVCTTLRGSHTSKVRKSSISFLLVIFRNLLKIITLLLGRRARIWWKKLPENKKAEIRELVWNNLLLISAFLALFTSGTVLFYVSHLEEDPITKRRRFIALTKEQMIQLTEKEEITLAKHFNEYYLPPSHPICRRVGLVTQRILLANEDFAHLRNQDWNLTVVDRPDIRNAFVLPNGNIYIFTGLLELCQNDDQLGIILCHEISHALLRHLAEQVSRTYFIDILFLIPIFIIWSLLPDFSAIIVHLLANLFIITVFHLPFSRNSEIEADGIGLSLAARSCFDVREASNFWRKMHMLSKYSSGNVLRERCEWLSTHPSYSKREVFLNKLTPAAMRLRLLCNCPELPLEDPRRNIGQQLEEVKLLVKVLEERERSS